MVQKTAATSPPAMSCQGARSIASTATDSSWSSGWPSWASSHRHPDAWAALAMDQVAYVRGDGGDLPPLRLDGVIMSVNTRGLRSDLPLRHRGAEAALADAARRRKLLGCFALSEPQAGSDAAAQRTPRPATATMDPRGTKNWITNGPVADVCVLFTMNDRGAATAHHRFILR